MAAVALGFKFRVLNASSEEDLNKLSLLLRN